VRCCALAFVVVAGCVPATGTVLEVQGPMDMTSTEAGIATLELVVGYPSYCQRWVQDMSASRTRVSVAGRDLDQRPYDFLVAPSHETNLAQPVYLAVLAYSATGVLVGEATFGEHPFGKDQVYKRQARVQLFPATVQKAGGPQYVASDGCVCVPGEPWLGTATGSGCDQRVITSFARLGDTAGCELPAGEPLPVPVCDGQRYRDEPLNRALPCFASDGNGACRMRTRRCADHDGVAWTQECVTDGGDLAVPQGSSLCSRYARCQETACGDVTGCLVASFTPDVATCTVRIDPATAPGQAIRPCNGAANWAAPFAGVVGQSCVAALVQGVAQPPFALGLDVNGAAQALATTCPLGLVIDNISSPYPMAVPLGRTVDIIAGEHLLRVKLNVQLDCGAPGTPTMECRLGL
jgi:hypothetical protein